MHLMGFRCNVAALALILAATIAGRAVAGESVKLPERSEQSGMDLFSALSLRLSTRSFDSGRKLSDTMVSDLLWAALGVNREDGRRTIPFSYDLRVVKVFLATESGCFLYVPEANELLPVSDLDVRSVIFKQEEFLSAPVSLVFVYDSDKESGTKEYQVELAEAHISVGAAMQNVQLAAAAFGLGTVAVTSIRPDRIASLLKVDEEDHVILAMPVGYPK